MAQPQPGAPRGGALEVVAAGLPTRKSLTLVTAQPARIEPIEQTPIHSKLAAYVSKVHADFGDRVKQGDALVELAAPELDAELEQKRSLLAQSKAEREQALAALAAAKAAVLTASAGAAQAKASVAGADADVSRWVSEFNRIEQLAASGSINRQLVDETQQKLSAARAKHDEAVAAVRSAEAAVQQAEAETAKAEADVKAADARIRVAEANLGQVDAMRSYLTIRAPYDGVVTQRSVDPGHFVQPASGNGSVLLHFCRIDRMRLLAAIPEAEAGYVDVGDAAVVDVPALRGAVVSGQVTRTSVALDASSRSLLAIVDLENTQGRLRPGMYATVRLTLQEQADVLTLPAAAVVRQGNEAFCYRLKGGKAVKTPLVLGIRVGDDFEVASGLNAEETVILNKASSLKDGQAVDLLKTPPPAKG